MYVFIFLVIPFLLGIALFLFEFDSAYTALIQALLVQLVFCNPLFSCSCLLTYTHIIACVSFQTHLFLPPSFLPLCSLLFSPLLVKSIQRSIAQRAAFRPIEHSDSDIYTGCADQLTDKRTCRRAHKGQTQM